MKGNIRLTIAAIVFCPALTAASPLFSDIFCSPDDLKASSPTEWTIAKIDSRKNKMDKSSQPPPNPAAIQGKQKSYLIATGFESPDYRQLPYRIVDIGENDFCLQQERVTTRVELRLMQQGIHPVARLTDDNFPCLEISMQFNQESFFIQLNLGRLSSFQIEDRVYQKYAIIWQEQVLGMHQHNYDIVIESLDFVLARFMLKYLSANQPDSSQP